MLAIGACYVVCIEAKKLQSLHCGIRQTLTFVVLGQVKEGHNRVE